METKKWVKENVVCLPKSMDELTTILEVHGSDNNLSKEKVDQLWYNHGGAERGGELLNLMTEVAFKSIFHNLSVPKKGDNRDTLSHNKVMELLIELQDELQAVDESPEAAECIALKATTICNLSVPENTLSHNKVMEVLVETLRFNAGGRVAENVWIDRESMEEATTDICNLSIVGVSEEKD